MTKIDVLSGLDTIRVCTSYQGEDDAVFDTFPYHQTVLHHARARYVDLPGWTEDITGCRREDELPQAARDYLAFIAEETGVPIAQISVGPARDQVIWTQIGEQTIAGQTASVA